MSASIAAARRRALTSRMTDSQLDFVLVYGNAWQSDYLRYVTDFGILEGEALALISRDGEVTLFVDSALEAERVHLESSESRGWSSRSCQPCAATAPVAGARTAAVAGSVHRIIFHLLNLGPPRRNIEQNMITFGKRKFPVHRNEP